MNKFAVTVMLKTGQKRGRHIDAKTPGEALKTCVEYMGIKEKEILSIYITTKKGD